MLNVDDNMRSAPLRSDDLQALVAELASRPGHEKVRTGLHHLLVQELGADRNSIDFEKAVPEVRGRIDALLGRTVFEFKSRFDRERRVAEEELHRYLSDRERVTRESWVGIATDGAEYHVYMLRDGQLMDFAHHHVDPKNPRLLVAWLESVVWLRQELPPDVETVREQLGRHSPIYGRALADLERAWQDVNENPEANLKRDLWHRLLSLVYGFDVESPDLFFQHTYLTIITKAIATLALFGELPQRGEALLAGDIFRDAGIVGSIEPDFFSWVLLSNRGAQLTADIAGIVSRFRLHDVEADVLKGLYESLIDPDQRHYLGEYYTPDWLAERMCATAIDRPLEQRVIDPACGSGTFLFHAVRRLFEAADEAELPPTRAIELALEKVAGIDVHPVAVIIARTTYLLALLPKFRLARPATVSIPVYLSDSLQWNVREYLGRHDLEIIVPNLDEIA